MNKIVLIWTAMVILVCNDVLYPIIGYPKIQWNGIALLLVGLYLLLKEKNQKDAPVKPRVAKVRYNKNGKKLL